METDKIFADIKSLIKKERNKERKNIITKINLMCNKIKEERLIYGERELIPYFNELRRWFQHDTIPIFEKEIKGEKNKQD